jgi:hypothetical protein
MIIYLLEGKGLASLDSIENSKRLKKNKSGKTGAL